MTLKNLAYLVFIGCLLWTLMACRKEAGWSPRKSELKVKESLKIMEDSSTYQGDNGGNTDYDLNRDILLYPVPNPRPVIIASPDPEPDPWIN